jgi:hypothetical protein
MFFDQPVPLLSIFLARIPSKNFNCEQCPVEKVCNELECYTVTPCLRSSLRALDHSAGHKRDYRAPIHA